MNIQYLYVCDKGLTNTQNIAIAFKKGKSILILGEIRLHFIWTHEFPAGLFQGETSPKSLSFNDFYFNILSLKKGQM